MTKEQAFELIKEQKTDLDYCVLKFTALKCRAYKDLKTEWIDL